MHAGHRVKAYGNANARLVASSREHYKRDAGPRVATCVLALNTINSPQLAMLQPCARTRRAISVRILHVSDGAESHREIAASDVGAVRGSHRRKKCPHSAYSRWRIVPIVSSPLAKLRPRTEATEATCGRTPHVCVVAFRMFAMALKTISSSLLTKAGAVIATSVRIRHVRGVSDHHSLLAAR